MRRMDRATAGRVVVPTGEGAEADPSPERPVVNVYGESGRSSECRVRAFSGSGKGRRPTPTLLLQEALVRRAPVRQIVIALILSRS